MFINIESRVRALLSFFRTQWWKRSLFKYVFLVIGYLLLVFILKWKLKCCSDFYWFWTYFMEYSWLINYILFKFENSSLIRRCHHCQWRAEFMLMAIEQEGIFIVSHLLWHGASVSAVSSQGPTHLVSSFDKQEVMRTYSDPDPNDIIEYSKGLAPNCSILYVMRIEDLLEYRDSDSIRLSFITSKFIDKGSHAKIHR